MGLEQLVEMSFFQSNDEFEDAKIRYSISPLLKKFVKGQLRSQPKETNYKFLERFLEYFSSYAIKEISIIVEEKKILGRSVFVDVADITKTVNWADAEFDNINRVLDLCYEMNRERVFIKIVKSLSYFFALRGYWNERIHRGRQAAKVAVKINDKRNEAWMYINEIGYILIQQGKFKEAEKVILLGLGILEKELKVIKDREEIQKDSQKQQGIQFIIGLAKRYLGIIHTKKLEYHYAEKLFNQALSIFAKLDRGSIIANQKTEMGELAFKQTHYNLANQYYIESLNYHNKQRHSKPWVYVWIARSYNGLGDIATNEGNIIKAKKAYRIGLKCAMKTNSHDAIAYSKFKLGIISEYEKNYALAVQYSKESIQILSTMGNAVYLKDVEKFYNKVKLKIRGKQ